MTANSDLLIRILERTDKKLDDLINTVATQSTSIAVQSEHISEYNNQLKEHMRRTELLEHRVEPLEDDLKLRETKKNFVIAHWKKLAVVAAGLSGLAGMIWSIMQILGAK